MKLDHKVHVAILLVSSNEMPDPASRPCNAERSRWREKARQVLAAHICDYNTLVEML